MQNPIFIIMSLTGVETLKLFERRVQVIIIQSQLPLNSQRAHTSKVCGLWGATSDSFSSKIVYIGEFQHNLNVRNHQSRLKMIWFP